MKLDSIYLSKSIGLLNPKEAKIVSPDTLVEKAIDILKSDSGGSVIITDRDEKLLGIFTERDVLKKIAGNQKSLKEEISLYMTPNPIGVEMTSPLGYALQLMSEGGFRHVPVVDESKTVLGVLSMKDVVDEIVKSFVLK